MVTVAPIAPLVGLNSEIVGVPSTLKLVALVNIIPLTITLIGPVAAPEGTIVVMVVEFELETVAETPL